MENFREMTSEGKPPMDKNRIGKQRYLGIIDTKNEKGGQHSTAADNIGQPCASFERTLIIGVLKRPPDSFSDGGRIIGAFSGKSHAQKLIGEDRYKLIETYYLLKKSDFG